MKTRTSFKLSGKGVVHCWCGAIEDFVKDVCDFIIPILEDSIIAEFNNREITVNPYDNADSIYQKFVKALNA